MHRSREGRLPALNAAVGAARQLLGAGVIYASSVQWHARGRKPRPLVTVRPDLWCGLGLYIWLLVLQPSHKFRKQSNACVRAQPLSRVQLFAILWTVAPQAPQSMGFFRQEYWSGLPFPSPGDLPIPGIQHVSCTAGRFFTTEPSGKPQAILYLSVNPSRYFSESKFTSVSDNQGSLVLQNSVPERRVFIVNGKC